jgi:hypothetical protein
MTMSQVTTTGGTSDHSHSQATELAGCFAVVAGGSGSLSADRGSALKGLP